MVNYLLSFLFFTVQRTQIYSHWDEFQWEFHLIKAPSRGVVFTIHLVAKFKQKSLSKLTISKESARRGGEGIIHQWSRQEELAVKSKSHRERPGIPSTRKVLCTNTLGKHICTPTSPPNIQRPT